MRFTIVIALGATLGSFLHADPKPGDADYPKPNNSARHQKKVKAVKSATYDLALVGDSITHTIGEMNEGKYAPNQAVVETTLRATPCHRPWAEWPANRGDFVESTKRGTGVRQISESRDAPDRN